ncbi:CDP-diacylglycerol--serine O-phosphatidyltransferase [Tunicatimonas pelagia]|uniref:CDP-diacylglycerol--serine O-phosphatidyltransferase n=1 Tax=Tunicatimonas pelagia TaxID=931531 RepID=UPI002665C57C|nr:CDP-diacylglycerol--serine O-phosphatidyltransferase [Tunicatimonas pelagia]WKN43975.1 CDP-diacylglycerol--serine O-phosphatidyltransferase [Tunicatimonas pelagia]
MTYLTKYIPNTITLSNLLSGCFGIVAATRGDLEMAAYFIWIAALLDFADGLVARALKAYSSIGGDLDSLADMVSFGVLPSFIMFGLIESALEVKGTWIPYLAFVIAAFSALRLAIFNVDTRQTDKFIGLPTPSSALLISALPLGTLPWFQMLIASPGFLIILALVDAYLLVASIELLAFKFKNYSWADNQLKYIFMILSIILFVLLRSVAIPVVLVLYIIVSVIVSTKSTRDPTTE